MKIHQRIALTVAALSVIAAAPAYVVPPRGTGSKPTTRGRTAVPDTLLGRQNTLTADQRSLNDEVYKHLNAIEDDKAIAAIDAYLKNTPRDQKVLILRAVIARSHGDAGGEAMLQEAVTVDAQSLEGKFAALVIRIDTDPTAFQLQIDLGELHAEGQGAWQLVWLGAMCPGQIQVGWGNILRRASYLAGDSGPFRARQLCANLLAQIQEPQHLRDALAIRQKLAEQFPSAITMTDWAASLYGLEQMKEAEAAAQKATELDAHYAPAWKLGWAIMYAEHKYDEAVAKAEHAAKLNDRDVEAFCDLGRALEKAGNGNEALDAFKAACRITDTHASAPHPPHLVTEEEVLDLPPDAACQEILNYFAAGKDQAGMDLLDQILEQHPENQLAPFLKGALTLGRIDKGDSPGDLLKRAAELDPETPTGKAARLCANVFFDDADKADAEAVCTMARGDQKNLILQWAAASAAIHVEQTQLARTPLSLLNDTFDPGPEVYNFGMGYVFREAGDYQRALAHDKLSVAASPGGWNNVALGITLGKLKSFDESNEAFAKGLGYNQGFSIRWCEWGEMLTEWGHYDDAMEKLKQAATLNPPGSRVFNSIGMCLLEMQGPDLQGARAAREEAARFYENLNQPEFAKMLRPPTTRPQ